MNKVYTRCPHFHDSQIEGAWCDIRNGVLGERLDCSRCENNPNVPRCGNCKHFVVGVTSAGVTPSRCMKVRGEVIFDSDGVPVGYVEHLKVRKNQVACNFYEKED